MTNIIDRLAHAATTAANDDTSAPGTPERDRHVARLTAMADAAAEIERLRAGLEELRDDRGYTIPAHFRRRAALILKEPENG